jgi:hypothetical protein
MTPTFFVGIAPSTDVVVQVPARRIPHYWLALTFGDRSHAARADGPDGHRSTRAALIYLHARDDRDKVIASGLDQMVTKLRSQQASPTKGHAGGTNDGGGQPQDRV